MALSYSITVEPLIHSREARKPSALPGHGDESAVRAIYGNSRGRLLQRPRISRPKAREGLVPGSPAVSRQPGVMLARYPKAQTSHQAQG